MFPGTGHAKKSKKHDISDAVDFGDDTSRFLAAMINSALDNDVYSHPSTRPREEDNVTCPNKHNYIGLNSRNSPADIVPPPD